MGEIPKPSHDEALKAYLSADAALNLLTKQPAGTRSADMVKAKAVLHSKAIMFLEAVDPSEVAKNALRVRAPDPAKISAAAQAVSELCARTLTQFQASDEKDPTLLHFVPLMENAARRKT